MIQEIVVQKLVVRVQEYARKVSLSVSSGAATPYLAAQLLQQYGHGVADSAAALFTDPKVSAPITAVLNKEIIRIDPSWPTKTALESSQLGTYPVQLKMAAIKGEKRVC